MAVNKDDIYWVLLGASAGGLEALKTFLENFSQRVNCYLIIAQHLDPKHPTILKELLSRVTDMPVELVTKDMAPKIGQVNIISPGHNATIESGKIHLSPAAEVGPKPSIDVLLNSMAKQVGEKAIAVILSGTGSDGARGIVAIKAENGVVFAQDQQTAKYNGMPNAAIATGVPDLVLAPDEIAKQISSYIKTSDRSFEVMKKPETKNLLQTLFQKIFAQTGYDFSGYKLKTIQRRIARRMAVHRIELMEDYLELLEKSPKEVDSLFKDFLISVTAFFRDKEAFEDLQKVIDHLVERTPESDTIRVWVAGCANGEEAYSIAILLHQTLVKRRKNTRYQVFASDIDEAALAQARKGRFSASQVEGVSDEIMQAFFVQAEGQFIVSKTIRDRVIFAKQNVINDPPFSKVDLVSCRNLLIYFASDLQKRAIQTFHFALKHGGYLFLGKSESAETTSPELFATHFHKSHIFVRKNVDLSDKVDQVQSANTYANAIKNTPVYSKPSFERQTIASRLEQVLLQEIVPASLVIDANGQVHHIRGEMQPYLKFPQGKIDTNLMSLAQDEIKVDLRALLATARENGYATAQSLFFSSENRELLFINIRRFDLMDDQNQYFIVSFMPAKVDSEFFVNPSDTNEKKQEVNTFLVNEVALFKERLHTSLEELETTNEELQSTNEELQSANEELQSTNEELQTANEELQSTNQELSTVNEELEVKTYELEQMNTDLEYMLSNMNEVIVVLDNRLRVVRYTQNASKVFDMSSHMIGQTITTVGLPIDIHNLRNQLLSVIDSHKEIAIKARYQSVVYSIRLVPYQAGSKPVSGILMFFEDVAHRRDLASETDCMKTLQILGDESLDGMMTVDENLTIVYINSQACELLDYQAEDLCYQKLHRLVPEPYSSFPGAMIEDFIGNDTAEESKDQAKIWDGFTFKCKGDTRKLLQMRIDNTFINGQKYYLIRLREGSVMSANDIEET